MIYSRSAEYAIRAFVHLAQVPEGKYAMVKNIAEQEDIPAHFLAKILQQLARKGLLRSSKGPTGAKPASTSTLRPDRSTAQSRSARTDTPKFQTRTTETETTEKATAKLDGGLLVSLGLRRVPRVSVVQAVH